MTRAEKPGEFWFKVAVDVCIIAVMLFGIVATGGWSPRIEEPWRSRPADTGVRD